MNKTEIPTPIYAAAGIGELAYEKLRDLPKVAARTADELRQRLATRERDLSTEWAKMRDTARQSRETLVATAAAVPERAATGYRNLVARGERVLARTTEQPEPAKVEVEVGPVEPTRPV